MTLHVLAVRAADSALLSTIAGNAATLVGIVGGFTVARVVALAGEHEGLQRELDEAAARLADAEERLAARDAEDLAEELDRAVWEARELLVSTSGQADPNSLLQSIDRADYDATPAQLLERLGGAAEACRACFALLEDRAEEGGVRYRQFKDARQTLTDVAPDEDPSLLERIWKEFEARQTERERLAKIEREKAQERARQQGLTGIAGAAAAVSRFAEVARVMQEQQVGFALKPFTGIPFEPGRVLTRAVQRTSREQLVREVDDARADVAQLRAAVAATSTPADLRYGLAVLAGFALVSIVLPVVLMALDVRVTPCWRATVTGLFVGSLLLLLAYIALTLRTASGLPFLPGRQRDA